MFMKWLTDDSSKVKRIGKRTALYACAMLIFAAAAGCGLLPDEQGDEEIPVINPPRISQKPEYVVTTATLETKVRGSGSIMSMDEQPVFFTEDGKRVKEIYYKIGDQVEAGAVIAELDVQDLHDELRQARLQFRNDEIEMMKILRNADEMTEGELEQAKIAFELKRTKLIEIEEKISRAKVKAPISGTIISMSMNRGDQVQAYQEVAAIADMSQLTVAAKFSKDDLNKIAVNMEAVVDINIAGQHTGKVMRLPVKEQSNSGGGHWDPYNPAPPVRDTVDNYLLVELDSFPDDVSRGTPLSVAIVISRKEGAVVIPPSALRTYGGRTYVQVVEDDGTKREADVEVGMQTSTQVEIVKGLAPGQKVVGR